MNSESAPPNSTPNWEALLHGREFEQAFTSATAVIEDHQRGEQGGRARITAGRIYFEFGHYQSAADHINLGIHMMPEDWLQSEERRWTEACSARAVYKASGSRSSLEKLTGETRQWFHYSIGTNEERLSSPRPPQYDSEAPWEVRIAGGRAHRRACRIHPLNTKIRKNALSYGKKLWEDSRPAGNIFDRILGIASMKCEAHFQYAALLFDLNEFSKADEEFKALLADGEHHVAALIAQVQTARALGLDSNYRVKTISAAIEKLNNKGFTYGISSLTKLDAKLYYEMDLARLCRQRALVEALTEADKAHTSCSTANDHAKRHSANTTAKGGPTTFLPGKQSFDLARYSIRLSKKDRAIIEGTALLKSVRLESLAALFSQAEDNSTDESSPIRKAEIEIAELLSSRAQLAGVSLDEQRRVLIVSADTLRAVGRTEEALAWYETIAEHCPKSFTTKARILSLLLYLRRSEEALTRAREYSTQPTSGEEETSSDCAELGLELVRNPNRASIEVEYAQALLVSGKIKEARHKFDQLCESEHHETLIDAWCGRIDCARRSRDLASAARLCSEAAANSKINQTGRSHVRIAEAWAEVQLGSPRRALGLALEATEHVRYSISGWIVCVRALRMLGRHSEAIKLVHTLDPPPSNLNDEHARLEWLPSKPPNWSVRHKGLLKNELGWCYHDLDQTPKAASTFKEAIEAAPHLAAAHRGLIASTDPVDLKAFDNQRKASVRTLTKSVGQESSAIRYVQLEAWRALSMCHHDGDVVERRRLKDTCLSNVLTGLDKQTPDEQTRVGLAIADLLIDIGHLSKAENELQTLVELQRTSEPHAAVMSSPEVLEILQGRIYLAQGNTLKARHLFDTSVAQNPSTSEAMWVAKIIATFEDREFDEALTQIQLWEDADNQRQEPSKIPTSDIRRSLRAWVHVSKSELPGPRSEREKNLRKAKNQLYHSDRTSTGELHLSAVIKARDGYQLDSDGRGYIKDYRCLREAIGQLDEALGRRRSNSALLRDQAAIYMAVGKLSLAQQVLDEAEACSPRPPPRTEPDILKVLESPSPGRPKNLLRDARIHLLRGWLLYLKHDTRKAVDQFERAVDGDPNDYVHHRALALARLELGEVEAASIGIRKGLNVVHNRRRLQLQLLGSRILAKQVDAGSHRDVVPSGRFLESIQHAKEPPHRTLLLDEARHLERLQERKYQPALSDWERAELVAHRALLHVKAHKFLRGLFLAKRATFISKSAPSAHYVRRHFSWSTIWRDPRVVTFSMIAISVALAVMLSLYTFKDSIRDGEAVDGVFVASILTLVLTMFLIGVLLPRLTLISLGSSLSMELDSSQPVEELVHADLDLPANRLLQISGFSNHRPTIPFDDVETRLLDPPEP